MKILVTGATGFIGQKLVNRLVAERNTVHIMYRKDSKLDVLLQENVKGFKGDINDISSIESAMEGCELIYRLAAFTRVWSKNKNDYFEINYTGTMNLLEAAIKNKVKKIVITSTAGVFGPSQNNEPINENAVRLVDYFNEYERTKDYADRYIMKNYAGKIDVVIVCPTRVFGPGELGESNSVTRMIKLYLAGKWRYLPGDGKSIGNYVYIDDVVKGMLLAMKHGKSGERYLLGGDNLSFLEIFHEITNQADKKRWLLRIPVWLMLLISYLMLFLARNSGIKPLITPGWTRKYLHNWVVSTEKARKDLGYEPLKFSEGLKETIKWLENSKKQTST